MVKRWEKDVYLSQWFLAGAVPNPLLNKRGTQDTVIDEQLREMAQHQRSKPTYRVCTRFLPRLVLQGGKPLGDRIRDRRPSRIPRVRKNRHRVCHQRTPLGLLNAKMKILHSFSKAASTCSPISLHPTCVFPSDMMSPVR